MTDYIETWAGKSQKLRLTISHLIVIRWMDNVAIVKYRLEFLTVEKKKNICNGKIKILCI